MLNEVMGPPELFNHAGDWIATLAVPVGEVAMQRSPAKALTPKALYPLTSPPVGASFRVKGVTTFMVMPVCTIGLTAVHRLLSFGLPLPWFKMDQPAGGVVPEAMLSKFSVNVMA